MRKYSHLSLGFLLILLSLPSIATAQYRNDRNDRRDRVCVYQDNNFRGAERCYNPGDSVPDTRGMGISSMRIEGRARIIAFANRNFRGQSDEFTSDVANMARVGINGNRNWNDRVQSFEVVSDRSGASGRYPDRYPVVMTDIPRIHRLRTILVQMSRKESVSSTDRTSKAARNAGVTVQSPTFATGAIESLLSASREARV